MLKSPVMVSSEGKGTKKFKKVLKFIKKGRDFRRWRTVDIEKDSFFVARSKFSCHEFKRDRKRKVFDRPLTHKLKFLSK